MWPPVIANIGCAGSSRRTQNLEILSKKFSIVFTHNGQKYATETVPPTVLQTETAASYGFNFFPVWLVFISISSLLSPLPSVVIN